MQFTTAATHFLKSQQKYHQQVWCTVRHNSYSQSIVPEEVSLVNLKCSRAWQPLTCWRAKDIYCQHALYLRGTVATYSLESQQMPSADLKYSSAQQPPTNWRARTCIVAGLKRARHNSHSLSEEPKERCQHQAWITRLGSYSLSRESRTGIVRRLEMQ